MVTRLSWSLAYHARYELRDLKSRSFVRSFQSRTWVARSSRGEAIGDGAAPVAASSVVVVERRGRETELRNSQFCV